MRNIVQEKFQGTIIETMQVNQQGARQEKTQKVAQNQGRSMQEKYQKEGQKLWNKSRC